MKHKDLYDDAYIESLANKLTIVNSDFNPASFSQKLKGNLDDKELFARFDFIVNIMEEELSDDYANNILGMHKILGPELETDIGMFKFGWWLWPIGKYVERNGDKNLAISMGFLKELTKRFTGEFAIRPLLELYPKQTLNIMLEWSKNDNLHVRRLASEGIRTRLPWAKKTFVMIQEFATCKTILTNLRNDPEKFIQKSVANNLNDLFKDFPEQAWEIINEWKQDEISKPTEWIIKHGTRSFRKK